MSTVAEIDEVRIKEPLWSVQSRVSWGALVAGAVVAIAVYSLLTLLGVAVAISFSDRINAEQMGTAAAYWTFASLLIAMFFGGWVSTRCTAGEFRSEAALYGVIVWGITSCLLVPFTALGVGTGVGAVLADRGIAKANNTIVPAIVNAESAVREKINEVSQSAKDAATKMTSARSDEKSSRDSGSSGKSSSSSSKSDSKSNAKSDSKSDNSKSAGSEESAATSTTSASDSGDNDQAASTSGETRAKFRELGRDAKEKAREAAWWAFGGTLISMLACILGALVGPSIVVVHHKYTTTRTGAVVAR